MERGPLSPTEFSSAVTAITSAFGDPTRRDIYLYVRDADRGVTASEAVQRSFRSALHAVADALSAHGFAAHAEKRGDGLRIVSEHCPFGDAAIEHPVICAVDRGLVKGMLSALYGETSPATESSLPM